VKLADLGEELQPVHARHQVVGHDDVGGVPVEVLERGRRVVEELHREAVSPANRKESVRVTSTSSSTTTTWILSFPAPAIVSP